MPHRSKIPKKARPIKTVRLVFSFKGFSGAGEEEVGALAHAEEADAPPDSTKGLFSIFLLF